MLRGLIMGLRAGRSKVMTSGQLVLVLLLHLAFSPLNGDTVLVPRRESTD